MRGTLAVSSVLLCVASTLWIVGWAVYWLYNRGEIATTVLVDRTGHLASEETQKRVYEQRVAWLHRFYRRLRRGLPWAVGVLVVGIGLAIASAHIAG
jgi:hypothetical protein